MLRLRNALVAPFGLSTNITDAHDKVGPFPVESVSKTELIAGFNDIHLDFRISILRHAEKIYLSTWVHPHNFAGRAYLRTVMPFHILIVRNALKRLHTQNP